MFLNASLNTSLIVIPFSKTACWSKYPTVALDDHFILPASGINFFVIIFKKLDFPSPLAPTRAICSPFLSLKDTFSSIVLAPKP